MTRRSILPFSGLLVSLLALLLLVPFLATAAQADPSDPASPGSAGSTDPQDVAEQALETVEELIEPDAAVVTNENHNDLTLDLRDLAAASDDLPKAKKDDAARLLARPDGSPSSVGCNDDLACWSPSASRASKCASRVCVHWVRNTYDKSSDAYALKALGVVNAVAERYRSAGYRVPVNDGGVGGSWKLDVYLADLSGAGAYGYCNSDQDLTTHVAAPAYCVLDNNYAASEYGTVNTATELLQVTAAHEFFHAVQFAYDVLEDRWFMEATATWVEDEVYDAVNDNRFYLRFGPLKKPHQPLDTYSTNGAQYGTWIFFRYLSEKFSYRQGGLPVIVRRMWENAAHQGTGAKSQYSVEAIRTALSVYKTNISNEFSSFVARNRQPARYYSEGSAYPVAAPGGSYRLTAGARAKALSFRLHHLAAKTVRYYPSSAMSRVWNLRVWLNLNSRAAGGVAIVTIKPTGKPSRMERVSLDANGNAYDTVPFGSRVDWVEISVVNASPRYTCPDTYLGPDVDTTCQGTPVDNNQLQVLNVRAFH